MPSNPPAGNSKPIRVGLLGAGVIAVPHVEAVRAVGGPVELAAVCDLDSAKVRAFQKKWAIPSAFDDPDAMLREGKLNVVHVLLPPAAHAAAAITCLQAGCDVFVEKPFCLSSQECRRVREAAEANGRRVGVNHNLTYMPSFLQLIEQIRSWRLGAVQHVTVMYNLPIPVVRTGPHGHWMFGGPERIMLELGPHPLSVIQRLLGSVRSAAGLVSGRRVLSNGEAFFDTWQASFDCERGSAQCVLALGGEFLSTWIHVIGQDGEAVADLRRNTLRVSGKTRYLRTDLLRDGWRNGSGLIRQSLRNQYGRMRGMFGFGPPFEMQNFSMNSSVRAFYEALIAGRPLPVSGDDGAAVVEYCEAVIASALASDAWRSSVEDHATI